MIATTSAPRHLAYQLYDVQDDFVSDQSRYVAFVGGRNCVAPETLIEGIPIAELSDASVVRTLYGPALASPAFLKGRDDLYRLRTRSGGVVVATLGHRLLTPVGWRPLSALSVGDVIASHETEDGRTENGITQDSTGHCFEGSRHNDGLSILAALGDRDIWPLPRKIDVDTIPSVPARLSSWDAYHLMPHQDGEKPHGALAAYARPQLLSRMSSLSHAQFLRQDSVGSPHPSVAGSPALGTLALLESHADEESWTRLTGAYRGDRQPHADSRALDRHQSLVHGCGVVDLSCVHCTTFWSEIVEMSFVRNGEFYDITVPSAGHYAAQGIWHHNSGKTYSGSIKAMLHAMQPGLGVVAAPNFPMLEHGAKRQFIDRMEESGIPFSTNNQKGNLTIPDTGAEVLFATLESESRVRGPNFNWGWTDELDYLSDQKVWKALMGAIRAGDNPQLFATSTPKGKRLIYREWVQNATERHHLYRATTYDNPFIDADDYVSGLGYEGRFADQEIGAEFVSFDGLVYDGFDRTRNVATVDTTGWRTFCGVDVGARNPTVVLTIHIAGDDRVHISREFYQRGMGSEAILAAIESEADITTPDSIYIDPSAAAYIDDLLRHGYPAMKANNDVQTGIQVVTSALPRLTVDPSCVETIAEFEAYQYPDEGRGTSDKPVKQNDHCLVAGTMIETAHGARPIESIQNGELVLTRDGYREVVSAGMTNPSAEVLTAYLSNGETITGTAGHPVFANGEWVLLESLRYGDTLMSVQEIAKCASKSSSTKASSSDDTRIPSAWQIGDTIGRTLAMLATAFHRCIVRFGKTISGRSPMVTTSTTLTATRTITTSRIWNASRLAIISAITGTSRHLSVNWSTLNLSVTLPLNGMAPTPVLSGIVSTASVHGQSDSRFVEPASNVASNMATSLAGLNRGSAPTNASRHGVAPVASMMKIAPALFAGRRSESTSSLLHELAPVYVERVVAQTERRAVYNLTVSETPEYFANGVLVHNCMDAARYCLMGAMTPPDVLGVW